VQEFSYFRVLTLYHTSTTHWTVTREGIRQRKKIKWLHEPLFIKIWAKNFSLPSLALKHMMGCVRAGIIEAIQISTGVLNSMQMWGKKHAVWSPTRQVWLIQPCQCPAKCYLKLATIFKRCLAVAFLIALIGIPVLIPPSLCVLSVFSRWRFFPSGCCRLLVVQKFELH